MENIEYDGRCLECGTSPSMQDIAENGPLILIGTMQEGGVYWSGRNPHCWPVGTKVYVQPPETKS